MPLCPAAVPSRARNSFLLAFADFNRPQKEKAAGHNAAFPWTGDLAGDELAPGPANYGLSLTSNSTSPKVGTLFELGVTENVYTPADNEREVHASKSLAAPRVA